MSEVDASGAADVNVALTAAASVEEQKEPSPNLAPAQSGEELDFI